MPQVKEWKGSQDPKSGVQPAHPLEPGKQAWPKRRIPKDCEDRNEAFYVEDWLIPPDLIAYGLLNNPQRVPEVAGQVHV